MNFPSKNSYLDIRNLQEVVGRVLLYHFSLAFQARTSYESFADLRAQASRYQDDHGTGAPNLAQIGKDTYAWYRFDERTDDGSNVIKPNDLQPSESGRWIKQKLPHYVECGTPKYFAWIEYTDLRLSIEEMWNRGRGQGPCLFISCLGDELTNVSQTRAYHFYELRYRLRVLSANFRGGVAARFGSPESKEQELDPGAAELLGWLRWYLISENKLGPTVGMSEVELKSYTPDLSESAERIISDYIEILVRGSVYTPNEPCDFITPSALWMKLQEDLPMPEVTAEMEVSS